MTNNVFANNLEIACKAADGKSVAAFPDVCFTPPGPPAGWIPIPYPNTAYAKHTSNASKTVFISGQPIMKKDQSYFSTSTGNEPAAGPKGIVTGVKKGKAYFTMWSMNVMVEGQNVDRHTDLMTHNHGSAPGNTVVWAYSDTSTKAPKECIDACININRECNKHNFKKGTSKLDRDAAANKLCRGKTITTQEEREKKSKKNKKSKFFENLMEKFDKFKKDKKLDKILEPDWKMNHCFPTLIAKPGGIAEQRKKINDEIEKIKKALDDLKNSDFQRAVTEALNTQGLIGIIVPTKWWYIWELSPAKILKVFKLKKMWNASEIIKSAKDVTTTVSSEIKKIKDFVKQLEDMSKKLGKLEYDLNNKIEIAKKKAIAEGKTQKQIEQEIKKVKGKHQEAMTSAMDKAAKTDGCIKARKCLLEPYNETGTYPGSLLGKTGCCPGQTPHHIIPGSYFRKKRPGTKNEYDNISNCKKYNHSLAPTFCAEGSNNKHGSHGRMHSRQDIEAAKHLDEKGNLQYENKAVKLDDAKGAKPAALNAFNKVFSGYCGENKNTRKCLNAQIDAYFKKQKPPVCSNLKGNLRAVISSSLYKSGEPLGKLKGTPIR